MTSESERVKNYRKKQLENPEKAIEYRSRLASSQRRYNRKKFETFISMYGGKCECCGEIEKDFLTLEHKNVTGTNARKNLNTNNNQREYINAVKSYRPDLYEILCYNCNLAQRRKGKCPHKCK